MPERIVTDSNGRKHITREPLLHARTYSQAELDAAVAAERERCAKLCDDVSENRDMRYINSAVQCAARIRGPNAPAHLHATARGQTK